MSDINSGGPPNDTTAATPADAAAKPSRGEGLRLLKAFRNIRDRGVRQSITRLVEMLGARRLRK